MSAKQKEAAKARRDAQDAADMKKYFAKHDAEMRKEEYELTIEDYSLEELEEFMMSEEFEQLDELSKKTLATYVRDASSHVGQLGWKAAELSPKLAATNAAARKAKKKLTFDSPDHQEYKKITRKWTKRLGGVEKAAQKLRDDS
jgi:hypothetical protein